MKRTGRLWVTHKNNFVLLRGRGPWTKESLMRFAESTPSLEFNFEQPWGTLACLYGESILTPAAKESFIRSHHWMVKKNMNAIAINLAKCEARSVVRHQLQVIYQECGCNFRFFEDNQSAIEWLTSHDINVDSSLLDFKPKNYFW